MFLRPPLIAFSSDFSCPSTQDVLIVSQFQLLHFALVESR